jgi:predicted nucleic acid-binding protein
VTVVVDASALLLAGAEAADPDAAALRSRLTGETAHAPHLIDAEIGNALRRLVLRGHIPEDLAAHVLTLAPLYVDQRHDHGPFAAAAWSMRANVTYYDALYIALAASLDVPLLTADARLARAPGLPCRVEVV